MADAVVDRTPMSRFFCHKCSIEIEGLLPDYTCPLCACGFIEELERGNNDSNSVIDASSEDLSDIDIDMIPGHNRVPEERVVDIIFGVATSGQSRGSQSSRNNAPDSQSRPNLSNRLDSRRPLVSARRELEAYLRDFVSNLSGAGHPFLQVGQPSLLFLGNPGDYVWGRDGLDAIVTQLLNQMDSTGPPPLPRKQIEEIPTTNVTQTQVDSKLKCSVCWEDFKLDEPVRQLPCQHVYHEPCIVPWLELHGTCPICRQSLGDQSSAEANQDTVGPSLDALFRAANESNSGTLSSSSTSPTGHNSSDNSWFEI